MEVPDAKQKMVACAFDDHLIAGRILIVPGSKHGLVALYLFLILV